MGVTISAVYRHDELAYQMIVTETGQLISEKDVDIEYLGSQQDGPFELSAYWNSVNGCWELKAEVRPHVAKDLGGFCSYVEDLQIAADMAREFREILNAE